MNLERQNIVFFDGVCNLCSRSVQWIIRRDRKGYFRFASLQSEPARTVLNHRLDMNKIDSLVLLEGGRIYTESTAVLRIARKLDGHWKWAAMLLLVPRPLRDFAYRFIARRRYQWFGKQDNCMLPTPDIRRRFLSGDIGK